MAIRRCTPLSANTAPSRRFCSDAVLPSTRQTEPAPTASAHLEVATEIDWRTIALAESSFGTVNAAILAAHHRLVAGFDERVIVSIQVLLGSGLPRAESIDEDGQAEEFGSVTHALIPFVSRQYPAPRGRRGRGSPRA